MKITVYFLLLAASCCITPAISTCVRRCMERCQPRANLPCMQTSLSKNKAATIGAMAGVLCAYDKSKDMRNKSELIRAVQNFVTVTGCTIETLLGSNANIDDLLMDVNGVLQNLLRTLHNVLNLLNLPLMTVPQCGPLRPLLSKISTILNYVAGLSEHSGITIGETNAGKQVPGALVLVKPGVLEGLTTAVGKLVAGLGGVTGNVGEVVSGLLGGPAGKNEGVLGTVSDLLSGLTGALPGLTGGSKAGVRAMAGNSGGVTNVNGEMFERYPMGDGGFTAGINDDATGGSIDGMSQWGLNDRFVGRATINGGSTGVSGSAAAGLNSDGLGGLVDGLLDTVNGVLGGVLGGPSKSTKLLGLL